MTTQEFSDGFDTLVNSYANKVNFGDEASIRDLTFDEYEKSLWLTKAQEEIVVNLYSGRAGMSFEETEEVRRYLSKLICEDSPSKITNTSGKPIGINTKSSFFTLKDDVWFITYEAVNTSDDTDSCGSISGMEVVPVTQDEYHKIKKNPFRGANKRRALRLDLSDNVVEIVCIYPVTSYYVRYIRKPKPIILASLENTGLKIDSKESVSKCELHEALHQRILDRAVALAVQSKGYGKTTKDSN